jgi:hypothetical protein
MPNDPDDPKNSSAVADLFPFDELSTGETSSLLKRAKLVTGFQDDPTPEVDPTLKPTTGRFLALKAAADSSRPATGAHAALKPSAPLPPRPGGTGSMPAFKPGTTSSQPAFNPSAPRPGQPAYHPSAPRPGTSSQPAYHPSAPRAGTSSQPAFNPSAPRPRPSTGAHAALDPDALQREIRARARHDAAVAPPPGAKPGRPVKPPLAAEDTFVKKKIRQAENNLPDWDFDTDDEDAG